MERSEEVTFQTLVTAFTDFLTVAIHTILYERAIYPQSSFLTARKYNYPVRQNRHPRVCQWIQDAITAIEEELLKSTIDRIALIIISPSQIPLERYVFEVSRFAIIPPDEASTLLELEGSILPLEALVNIQEQFRGAMSRLAVCGGLLGPLPTLCSFTLAIELRELQKPPIDQPQLWIPVQPPSKSRISEARSQEKEKSDLKKAVKLIPLRTVDTPELQLEMWIEDIIDGKAKYSANSSAKT